MHKSIPKAPTIVTNSRIFLAAIAALLLINPWEQSIIPPVIGAILLVGIVPWKSF